MRFRPPAFPHIHFMAAAPLDAWARLLLMPGARIPLRYWPRVGVNLVLSACVTVLTLPERVALGPALWWLGRRCGWRLGRRHTGEAAPAIVVLGYYRSGTTHLHNLLACDPHNHTPRWGQVLAPQGFVLSWFVLKLFLWAALPTKRPQDDMAFGPEWPGEDDFALSNWTLSSPLAGRVVLPDCYEHFARYNDLERLNPSEKARWRRTQWGFLFKMSLMACGRRLLLKTPPHTAKVPAIMDVLGGPARVKFIHLSRDPAAVLKSNERLMRSMQRMHLQNTPNEGVIRERLAADYALAERCFAAAEPSIPPGNAVRMRYEDLIADPERELKRAYAALRLEWTPAFEAPLRTYLASVAEYRSETQKLAERDREQAGDSPAEEHGRARERRRRARRANSRAVVQRSPILGVTGLACLAIWAVVTWLTGHHNGIFAMLSGIAIGHVATARRPGSPSLGIVAGWVALNVAAAGMLVATLLVDVPWSVSFAPLDAIHAWWRRFTHESTLLWTGLGVLAAYRLASRRFGGVPGR